MTSEDRIIGEARYLRLVARRGWEFTERKGISGIVGIVAVTDCDELVLVEQYRPPVDSRVVELPAGLIGDVAGSESESVVEGARRELLEETGYDASRWQEVTRGPLSPGTVDEVMTLLFATGLTRLGPGGGEPGEDIRVHVIPLAGADEWLQARQAEGLLVDPKVYAGLHFAGRFRGSPGSP